MTLLLICTMVWGGQPAYAKKKTSRSSSSNKHSSATAKVAQRDGLESWTARVRAAEERLGEQWTVSIQDLDSTQTIYEYQSSRRLTPASNRKLITYSMAVEKLGPDYKFRTEFGLDAPFDPKRAHYYGNVILRSNGDPSLAPPFYKQQNPGDLFEQWARDLAAKGVAYVHGDLVIDASAFGEDQGRYPDAWDISHRNYSYAPVPSALAISQNMLRISVRPAKAGQAANVSLAPFDGGITLDNKAITRSGKAGGIAAAFDQTTNNLTVSGSVRSQQGEEVVQLPLPQPLTYVSAMMKSALVKAGVSLLGKVIVQTTRPPGIDPPPIKELVGLHESPPLNDLLVVMMHQSDNFLAEQIWHATAARVAGMGDTARARQMEQEWYADHQLPWIEPGWDGSGLSRKDKISSAELVQVIRFMYHSVYKDYLLGALPVSGRSGTLRHRSFGGTDGRVAAKTGTLSGAASLTGFIKDKQGRPRLVFSAIGNAGGETNGRLSMRINQLLEIAIDQLDSGTIQPFDSKLIAAPAPAALTPADLLLGGNSPDMESDAPIAAGGNQ